MYFLFQEVSELCNIQWKYSNLNLIAKIKTNLKKVTFHNWKSIWQPPWGRRGFKPTIPPPYPQRVVKDD